MYVTQGLGQTRRQFTKPGTRAIPVPRLRLIKGRGFGDSGSSAATCTSPNYWNPSINTCCAPLGTPPGQDPCSILNQPGFLAAQAQDVGPIGANGVPLSSPNYGVASPNNLADLSGYPNNVQADVQECYENPGSSFIDAVGMQVNCPLQSTAAAPGINVSAFTYAQLAAMLAPSITPTTQLLGNQPYANFTTGTPATVPPVTSGGGGGASGSSYPVGVRISGSNFNVGDSWTITVSGPPNSQVTVAGTQNGTSIGSATPMGTIGAGGTLTLSGTFTASQVGNWVEQWSVGGQNAGSVSFSVNAPSGSGGTSSGGSGASGGTSNSGGSGNGGSTSTNSNPFGFLTNTVTIAGIAIPIWGVGAGVLAALWVMGRK